MVCASDNRSYVDCTRSGKIVLDCNSSPGCTLVEFERAGRSARMIECDPLDCEQYINAGRNTPTSKRSWNPAAQLIFDL